jgi:riboflavin synthase
MFTGLIEGTGKLLKVEPRGKDMRLSIVASFDLGEIEIGESVSVDGVCLTVVSWKERTISVDVSQETLSRTILGHCRSGDEVNLERALKLGDRLGGRYLIEKGSVAVNGVSLTVNRCDDRSFEVNVIPHTAQVTTLVSLRKGDEVNIEVDMIGKYVEKFMRNMRESSSSEADSVDRDFLGKHGFL